MQRLYIQTMNGQATALREVSDIHISAPPEEAMLLDARGDAIPTKRTGLMARIDAKGSEEITIRRSTLWFVGTLLAVIPVAIVIGALLIGYGRESQSQIEKTIQMQSDIQKMSETQKRIEERLSKFDERMQEQEKVNERTRGYQLGQTDAGASGHKK